MGQPWAAGSTDGAPAQLPLVLTALWAAAVGLELAYVLVLGPGPPPLGPLARALQLALAAFQLLNLLGNVGLFLRSDPSIRGVMLAGRGLGQGWAYCYQCQSQVPPRSGHCSACRVCILRRDHHCRLLGRCVGFGNYRPFLCLLLHAAGVLLHVSVLLGPALSALLRAHTPLHMAALLLLPWLMLLTDNPCPATALTTTKRSPWCPRSILCMCLQQLSEHPRLPPAHLHREVPSTPQAQCCGNQPHGPASVTASLSIKSPRSTPHISPFAGSHDSSPSHLQGPPRPHPTVPPLPDWAPRSPRLASLFRLCVKWLLPFKSFTFYVLFL
ncbi:putative palmitoyltransferase ZDHHC24 isoform X1 [Homo sapiens]|uniref:putative palmitoyltransferase ZDHHC24 isoform X1 n=1 Tax=Homo sapiens TaxID=9606 RepID=UPI000387C3E5|nr:probable palmitoyltransferase ZDHHC24 isoform X1 [Homo sapiens]XP_054224277.1 probable palmitoyltransferase ZDHHC24 isoform X1 [Homo sapiens]